MRTTTNITQLLGSFFLLTGLLSGSCTSEQTEVENAVPPTTTEGNRREVLLTLKNKLALTGSATRADGIATKEENAVATLDVYVFASATEGGTYTYQERFAYRGEGQGELPEGATSLPLAVDGADNESKTSGLLSLKKGLFVKFYCVANAATLTDPVTGNAVEAAAYQPLKLDEAGTPGVVAQAGKPTETEFLTYHTPLLSATEPTDVLVTPLPMSGAYTTPLDLTDAESTSRLQVGFKLTRLVARFDVVNKASESRFTLQSISMGKGRRGSSLFPIAVCGTQPAANGELITYPEIAFAGDKANQGTQTGAFYSYPSPTADSGYLIFKGLYQVNLSETKEVTYQVPFRQKAGDGGETYLEISHNHRYTIALSKADEYHLDADIRVADWSDDGSIDDFEPENKPGEIAVTFPPEYADESEYSAETKTMSMSIRAGSTFEFAIATNYELKLNKVYAGGVAGQSQNWLTISAPTITAAGALSTYRYAVSLTTPYALGRFPRATLRLTNLIDGTESILFVEPVAAPIPIETTQPAKAPNGTSDNPNTFDPNTNLASLYRITGSRTQVKINCPDGVEVDSKPDWLDVTIPTQVGAATIVTLTLNNREAAENTGEVVFRNKRKPNLTIGIDVALMDALVTPSYASIGGDNAFTPEVPGTSPADISLAIKADNSIGVRTTSMDAVSIRIAYPEGSSEWLQFEGASAAAKTRFAAKAWDATGVERFATRIMTMSRTQDLVFRPVASKLAGAQKATVTLVNNIGGADCVFTITPAMPQPVTVESTTAPSVPAQSVLKAAAITLYQLPGAGGATSQMTLDVASMGGSALTYDATDGGTGLTLSAADSKNSAAAYVLKPALIEGTNRATGTLHIKNYTDRTKATAYAVTVLRSDLTGGTAMTLNAEKSQTAAVTVSSPEGFTIDAAAIDWGGGSPWFTMPQDNAAGNNVALTATATGSANLIRTATVTLKNKIANGGDLKVTVTPLLQAPQLSATSGTAEYILNNEIKTLTVTAPAGGLTELSSNTGVATVSRSGNIVTVKAVGVGTATITVSNISEPSKKATYTLTVSQLRNYDGAAVWKYNGYYIAPKNAVSDWGFDTKLSTMYCSPKGGGTWLIPNMDAWEAFAAGLSPTELSNVFPTGSYWTSTKLSLPGKGYAIVFPDNIISSVKTKAHVRCLSLQ